MASNSDLAAPTKDGIVGSFGIGSPLLAAGRMTRS